MGGQGMQIGGLALALLGVLGVAVTCGLPMWRETSFVGANIVNAQWVWDGLWLHCITQSTGQMQCKRHTTLITMTSDIKAGRILTLISIVVGFFGFIVALLGGGAVNCSGTPPDPTEPPADPSTKKKVSLLGGVLCLLSGILCLISVSWSAGATISFYNDPMVVAALKREVGSSIYLGWVSSVLLLLAGALMCLVCGGKERPAPSSSDYSYTPYTTNYSQYSAQSGTATPRSNIARPDSQRMVERAAQVYDYNSPNKGMYYQP